MSQYHVTRVYSRDSEGDILLYGTNADGSYFKSFYSLGFETYLNSGSATLTMVFSKNKVNNLFANRNIKLGDATADQQILIYYGNSTQDIGTGEIIYNDKLLINCTVTAWNEERNKATLTAVHDAIGLSQNRNEFMFSTDENGELDIKTVFKSILQDSTLTPAVLDEDGQIITPAKGYSLTVQDLANFEGVIRATGVGSYAPNTIVYKSQGQYPKELLEHLMFLTAGYGYVDSISEINPIVYYPNSADRRTVIIDNFNVNNQAVNIPIILSKSNKSIRGNVETIQPDKETVINRAYFYQAVPATYDENGNLISPGNSNMRYDCIFEPDTIGQYGSRAVGISYPEIMDKETEGRRTLTQMGCGICKLQNDPQTVLNVPVDFNKVIELYLNEQVNGDITKIFIPINQIFTYLQEDGTSKDYVCIGFNGDILRGSINLQLAEKSPYTNEEMAEITSLQEQRISALESKTMNLTNELVMAIGSASWQRVLIDCNKDMGQRGLENTAYVKSHQVTPVSTATTSYCGTSALRWNYIYGTTLNLNGSATTRTITPASTATYNLGSSSLKWNYVYATYLDGSLNSTTGTHSGNFNGAITANVYTRSLIPNSDSSYTLGNNANRYSTIYCDQIICSSYGGISTSSSVTTSNQFATRAYVDSQSGSATAPLRIVYLRSGASFDIGPSATSATGTSLSRGYCTMYNGLDTTITSSSQTAILLKLEWGYSGYNSGTTSSNITFVSSFTRIPAVLTSHMRTQATAMADYRSAYNCSTTGFSLTTDASRVGYLAIGY